MMSSKYILALTLGVVMLVTVGISGVWYNRYIESFRGDNLAAVGKAKKPPTTSPYQNNAQCFDGKGAKANSNGVTFEGHDWGITYFAGAGDIRIDNKRTQCAMERNEKTGAFYYPKDSQGKKQCISYPKGSVNGGVGYSEKGSVSGEYLRDIDTSGYIGAYPLDKNLQASGQLGIDPKKGSANNYKVKDQCINVCGSNSDGVTVTISAKIIDRGPGKGHTIDVSEGLVKKMKKRLQVEPDKVDVQLGECMSGTS